MCVDPDYSFITPIFLHVGIIHILLNLFAQFTLSAQVSVVFPCQL